MTVIDCPNIAGAKAPVAPVLNTPLLSDVMLCQIRIFETKMTVKIGAIFMSFSNPTCHLRDTADFTAYCMYFM